MDTTAEENYIIKKAKLEHASDPYMAKAWILAAKTLYPKNFTVQFEAYCLEKSASNYIEAASCFSNIVLTFPKPPTELWTEVAQLTAALRITDDSSPPTPEQDFFVKMFQHITYEVQQKILLLIAGQSENNLEHCRLILLLMKRFPQAIPTHSPRLVETLIDGISSKQPLFRELFIDEVLPLILKNPPALPSALVNRILAICFEYFVTQVHTNSTAAGSKPIETSSNYSDEVWQRLFEVLDMCGRILKWEPFLAYEKSISKDAYWKKVCQIVSAAPPRPSENKQILFCSTIVFMMTLDEYMRNVKVRIGDVDVNYILMEGFRDIEPKLSKDRRHSTQQAETPHISISPPCDPETPVCLVTASQCWQLLHSNEILQKDFNALLRIVPASEWIARFVVDLAFYMGTSDIAKSVLSADGSISQRERHLRTLSLMVAQPSCDIPAMFDLILKIISDLPTFSGSWIPNLSSASVSRHLILLPISRRAIIQYCTKVLVKGLKQKIHSGCVCSDSLLGNLLVLLQLDWPAEQTLAEQVFNVIQARGEFTYLKFSSYFVCADFIEQFMAMWYPHGGDVNLVFCMASPGSTAAGTRRIGTRGADKGVKDDFKQIIKQQIQKCNDDVELIVQRFIIDEHMQLLTNMFEK